MSFSNFKIFLLHYMFLFYFYITYRFLFNKIIQKNNNNLSKNQKHIKNINIFL